MAYVDPTLRLSTMHDKTPPRRNGIGALAALGSLVLGISLLIDCPIWDLNRHARIDSVQDIDAPDYLSAVLMAHVGTAPPEFEHAVRPVLENRCIDCHEGEDAEGGFDLDRLVNLGLSTTSYEAWEQVLTVVESNVMPPAYASSLEPNERETVQRWIKSTLSEASQGKVGNVVMRRLSRVEYENTIQDLFRMQQRPFNNANRIVQADEYFDPVSGKIPDMVVANSVYNASDRMPSLLVGVSNLPTDPRAEHGFSNEGEALTLSPLLMEKYYRLAVSIVRSRSFPRHCEIWDELFEPPDLAEVAGLSDLSQLDWQINLARDRLRQFLPRAFRRPVTDDEIERYTELFAGRFRNDRKFKISMQMTVAAVLISPNFLYRVEQALDSSEVTALGEYELANRLSYFLWASMPDDELFAVAESGTLQNEEVLLEQVARMMKSRKVKSLAIDFGMQWLKTDAVTSTFPDEDKFPAYFHGKYRKSPPGIHMMIEQLLLFETIMVENRSILEFIDTDYAYLNRKLLRWYRIDSEKALGDRPVEDAFTTFYRVRLPDKQRGGILTSGAMLLGTSTSTRTSPVFRGAWVLDVIFNQPPPPPPANVPSLEDNNRGVDLDQVSLRERIEQHRANPACASCHDRIDPLGLALENFDPIGRWRSRYENGDRIVTSGDSRTGTRYASIVSLKEAVMARKDEFARAFVEHMLRYALGRELKYYDDHYVREIVSNAKANDYRFSEVVEEIVTSKPFRYVQKTRDPIDIKPLEDSDESMTSSNNYPNDPNHDRSTQ